MSTYTGDATIVNFLSASTSLIGPTGGVNQTSIAYTVPAGRFAEVQLLSSTISKTSSFYQSSSTKIGGVTIHSFVDDGTTASDNKNFSDYPGPIWLNEGETVSVSLNNSVANNGTASINVRIKEYNKP